MTHIKILQRKNPFKKHTNVSINQIYELRGRLIRKLKVWSGNSTRTIKNHTWYGKSKQAIKKYIIK